MKNILFYNKPAQSWLESMPLGNGRLGAMITGCLCKEVIHLDEESIWGGCPTDNNRPDAHKYIDSVRKLIFAGEYSEARDLSQKHLTGLFRNYGTHLRAGSLVIDYKSDKIIANGYRRELDIENAVAKVSYSVNSTQFFREYFASNVDDIICIRFTADKAAAVNMSLSLISERRDVSVAADEKRLRLKGRCEDGGVDFEIAVGVKADGGSYSFRGDIIDIKNADAVTLFIDINSSYRGGNFRSLNAGNIESASFKPYSTILDSHRKDFSSLFNRVCFEMDGDVNETLTIDERLRVFQSGINDLDLITKFFQFGRYLLISSSREGSLAAHLQGVWNDNIAAMMGWTCDYHLDINTQMNYWPAEVCNLAECHTPAFKLAQSLVEPGRNTAAIHYGCPGWVAHVITNLWGFTAPGAQERWGFFPTGGLWLALHLADHYRFTGDMEFLKQAAYPLLKESAEFFLAFLVEEPDSGYLVTCPATSEENIFETENGQRASVCAGPTCDNTLLRELLSFCIEASESLGIDSDLRTQWRHTSEKLAPYKIGRYGQLQEWLYDFAEPEPQHRHISHLLGVYPFSLISPYDTPELAEAAKTTLRRKMNLKTWEAVGWNRAWNINLFARLGESELALENIRGIMNITRSSLLTYHPPFGGAVEDIFEMDGNTGATAGIAEMLLQSGSGIIRLLPALPEQWARGSIKGLRARGGFEVDIYWKQGRLSNVKIRSMLGAKCRVIYGKNEVDLVTVKGGQYCLNGKLRDN